MCIRDRDGIFDDAEAWGVDTLKGWIDSYESSRFTAIDSHTAVITSAVSYTHLDVYKRQVSGSRGHTFRPVEVFHFTGCVFFSLVEIPYK